MEKVATGIHTFPELRKNNFTGVDNKADILHVMASGPAREFLLYGIIGCGSTALDFLLFTVLTGRCHVHYQIANLISVATSLSNGFLLNYYFNFKVQGRFFVRLASFYLVGMLGWLLGAIQLWLFIDIMNMNVMVSKLAAIFICTLFQFALNKQVTFRRNSYRAGGPIVERLPWDSDFFGVNVGRIRAATMLQLSPRGLVEGIAKSDAGLIYVEDPVTGDERTRLQDTLEGLGAKIYDVRTTYVKQIPETVPAGPLHGIAAADQLTGPIEELALTSGWCSRFAKDERLRPHFRRLYTKWIERDFAEGKVFVCTDSEEPVGLASVSVRDNIGKIGLVAVAEKFRGRGLAKLLMAAVDSWLASQGIQKCEVVTQGGNLCARKLYERVGFNLVSQCNVWHLWRKCR